MTVDCGNIEYMVSTIIDSPNMLTNKRVSPSSFQYPMIVTITWIKSTPNNIPLYNYDTVSQGRRTSARHIEEVES